MGDVQELLRRAGEVDLLVVTTPPNTHYDIARSGLEHGLALVVDKPFVVAAAQGSELIAEAQSRGLLLTVFQNRRYDGDFLTIQRLIRDGALGTIHSLESRFEWWKPEETKAWKARAGADAGGGILYDLGPHLLDQACQLFGPVASVHAELSRYRSREGADDEAFVSLDHASGVRTHAAMSSLAPVERPRFTLVGSAEGYVKWGLDIQESQLKEGMSPLADGYGEEPERQWGHLGSRETQSAVPTERGRYGDFYAAMATALRDGTPPPVDPAEALAVIELIQQIYASTAI